MKCPNQIIINSKYTESKTKMPFTTKKDERFYRGILVPCGTCIVCRRNRSMEWTTRVNHELIYEPKAQFLTITYATDEAPIASINNQHTLKKEDIQLFLKRLRKSLEPDKLKYILVGEYGPTTLRPHYHAILFGYQSYQPDVYHITNSDGVDIYFDAFLEEVWSHGHVQIGSATSASAHYVTAYLLKGIDFHRHDPSMCRKKYCANKKETKEEIEKIKWHDIENKMHRPFLLVSRGLGKRYLDDNVENVIELNVLDQTKPKPVPRYYIKKLKEMGLDINRDKIINQSEENDILRIKSILKQGGYDGLTTKDYKKLQLQVRLYDLSKEQELLTLNRLKERSKL